MIIDLPNSLLSSWSVLRGLPRCKIKSIIHAALETFLCSNSNNNRMCSLHLSSTLGRHEHYLYVGTLIDFSSTTESAINPTTLHSITGCLTQQSITNCQEWPSQSITLTLQPPHPHPPPPYRSKSDICQRWVMLRGKDAVEQLVTVCSDTTYP